MSGGATSVLGGEIPRDRLTAAVDHGPEHLRAIYWAVRDGGIGFATISQRAGRFDLPRDRPIVAILGDDMDKALGPAAFHRKSVRRFAARCRTASIVSCAPLLPLYAAPALAAMGLGLSGLIVETQPLFESDWADLILEANPTIALLIGTVKPEGGIN